MEAYPNDEKVSKSTYIFSLSTLIAFFDGKVIQIYQFI